MKKPQDGELNKLYWRLAQLNRAIDSLERLQIIRDARLKEIRLPAHALQSKRVLERAVAC